MHVSDLTIGVAQRIPLPFETPLTAFAADVAATLACFPEISLLSYPELHLVGLEHLPLEDREAALRSSAQRLDSPFVAALGTIAAHHGIWLCPGSIIEVDESGAHYNTQLIFDPGGSLRASYRKMFPWRPYEKVAPGTQFEVLAAEGLGHIGLSNCYDTWFPEHSRQLAWLGAEVILNIAQSRAADRAQELVLARAHAITNQCMFVSVNCAAPFGRGRSLIIDAEGEVLADAGTEEATIVATIADARVEQVRTFGTAGLNRLWGQFVDGDAPIHLPMYNGSIDPANWAPRARW